MFLIDHYLSLLTEVCAELFYQDLGLLSCDFSFSRFDFVVLFLILDAQFQDVVFWHDFSLCLGGDFFHKVNHSAEHGFALFEGLTLLLGAHKDKLGVFLPCSALHLNESLHSEQLIQADYLVACGYI